MVTIEWEAKMNDSMLHVALEIADHEIRFAIGQFYNTRLNILKVERVACSGILGAQIIDQASVVNSLKAAALHVQDTLGLPLKRVVLALPSVSTHRYTRRIEVEVDQQVNLRDLQKAMAEALKTKLPESQELINVFITKSIVNGITMRRLPINEVCDSLVVDVDLICADRDLVYRYAQTVEKAGLEISEISLDSYAFGKEASLFEKSLEQYVISLKLERQSTTLSLFAKGKLMSSEVLDLGTHQLIGELAHANHLPLDVADRLLHHNVRFGLDHYPTTPIYLWSSDGKTMTVSEQEIAAMIDKPLQKWLTSIKEAILPILATSNARLVLYGESAEINGLDTLLSKLCGCECELYIPETLGMRSSSLATLAGLFYVVKDQSHLRRYDAGVDMVSFEQMIQSPIKENPTEDTLSGKLKGLFERRN